MIIYVSEGTGTATAVKVICNLSSAKRSVITCDQNPKQEFEMSRDQSSMVKMSRNINETVSTIREAPKVKTKEGQARLRASDNPATPQARAVDKHGKKVKQEDHRNKGAVPAHQLGLARGVRGAHHKTYFIHRLCTQGFHSLRLEFTKSFQLHEPSIPID